MQDLFDLSGRVAIVTGGGSGIGRQMAEALAELGANLVLCARKVERCEQAAAELSELGVRALGMRCDVRDPEQVQTVCERTMEELGRLDVLVNNAGTSWGAPAEETPLEGWQKVVDVNLTGVFLFSQAAGRMMIDLGGGSIVNIASVAGLRGSPAGRIDAVAYNASKGGVIAFTRDLAHKSSDMSKVLLDRFGEEFVGRVPLGRFGGADDLKGAVAFLASPASAFVTGHTLVVDGGQSA